jgi:hypothetical protein
MQSASPPQQKNCADRRGLCNAFSISVQGRAGGLHASFPDCRANFAFVFSMRLPGELQGSNRAATLNRIAALIAHRGPSKQLIGSNKQAPPSQTDFS